MVLQQMGDVIQLKRKPKTERFTLTCPCGCDKVVFSIEQDYGMYFQCPSCGNDTKIDSAIAVLMECLENG